jgi:predicted RNA-binding Zn-ribbon protein involved in translation (DUF1610 family)
MRVCISGCKSDEGPIEATRGLICEACYERIDQTLPKVGAVLGHLREVYAMASRGEQDGSQRIKKDPPAPLNVHALDLTQNIFYALFEAQPRATWEPWEYLEIADAEAKRIQAHLPGIANSRKVQSLINLPRFIRQALNSYPMQEQPRKTLLPCPNCNKRTIYAPPQHLGDNVEVMCFDCGFRIPPEKMEFYANLAEREAAQ